MGEDVRREECGKVGEGDGVRREARGSSTLLVDADARLLSTFVVYVTSSKADEDARKVGRGGARGCRLSAHALAQVRDVGYPVNEELGQTETKRKATTVLLCSTVAQLWCRSFFF